jgi:hypothetical protein
MLLLLLLLFILHAPHSATVEVVGAAFVRTCLETLEPNIFFFSPESQENGRKGKKAQKRGKGKETQKRTEKYRTTSKTLKNSMTIARLRRVAGDEGIFFLRQKFPVFLIPRQSGSTTALCLRLYLR